MTDQLSAAWVEQGLHGVVPLPNVERLRAHGTTFSRAFTTNPVCCPARATIATGLSAHAHGVLECGYRLDPTIPTFMRALQTAGWTTGVAGKVHLLPQVEDLRPDYTPYGFDVAIASEDPRAGEWLDWVRASHPEHYQSALATVWMTMAPELRHYGPQATDLATEISQIRSRVHWSDANFPDADADAYVLPFPAAISQTEWITKRGLELLDSIALDKSFFLQISYVQPHNPFAPPVEYVNLVGDVPDPIPAEWLEDQKAPTAFSSDEQVALQDSPRRSRHVRRMYFADLAHLDAQLGRVLDRLEAAARLDETFVIFLSDHGELLGDHGFYGKWGRHYDACVRIPLIVSGPGIAAGATCSEMVDLTDIAPTILEMAGLQPPTVPVLTRSSAEPREIAGLAGRSLLPLSRGQGIETWRDAVYIESNNPFWSTTPRSWARTIRTSSYRYTVFPSGGGEQLFDLESDPQERHNLAFDPVASAVRLDLRDRLIDMLVAQDYPPTPRGLFKVLGW